MAKVYRHFRIAKESRGYYWPRTLCGARGWRQVVGKGSRLEDAWKATLELRAGAVVTCPVCMVIKDAWLDLPKRKPLTLRRAREFVKSLGFVRGP